jgi:DNA-binding PadR family transcriptional regulator
MHPHQHPQFAWAEGRGTADDERGRRSGPRGHRGHDGHEGHGPRGPLWLAMSGRRGPGGRRFGPGGPGGFGPGFGPGFGGPPFGGRGPRARRGDIRVAVLRLLSEQPMHGYQIIQELGARTGGVWNPSPGSVYPTLSALEDQGLVRAEEVDGKRVFHLTDAGREQLAADAGRPAPWDDVAAGAGEITDLHDVTIGVVEAARQVSVVGSPGQTARALTLLREVRRKLYQILAEDPEAPAAGEG